MQLLAATTAAPCGPDYSPHPQQSANYAMMEPLDFTAKESASYASDQSLAHLHALLLGTASTSQQAQAMHSSAALAASAGLAAVRRTTMMGGPCALDHQHEAAMEPMCRLLMEASMSRCVGAGGIDGGLGQKGQEPRQLYT